ncbi:hypothetical protein C475_07010 [Halosimplex carlsbadense 2-9-1]|uniref:Uncharacterized protein n=1 Tax=Halosimplex carlsbadense 2-9-1 TaxID=797114 RepID=M0CWS4_9EURY|nr:hypothetical protein [Halosimplex carlsbadense]ELZ27650.1 hypothetical protein C475_07010 [Halosimplex carlsbadense 2-9-1]
MSAPPATLAFRRRLRRLAADAAAIAERLAFWAGVALPCVYLPILAVYGVTADTAPALLGFWTLHAAALLVGRRHSPGEESRDRGRRGPAGRDRAHHDAVDDHRDRPTDP